MCKEKIKYKHSSDPCSINCNSKKVIALTFDDGPSDVTHKILDKLEEYEVPASFFLIGENITEEKRDIILREIDLGCEIANHSWNHPAMPDMTKEEMLSQIDQTNKAIYNAAGVLPKFFRPPYIAVNDAMHENIDLTFICGIGCSDWDDAVSVETRVKVVLESAADGGIILLHDGEGNVKTVEALDGIITGLKEKGYSLVTVSQLFAEKEVDPKVKYKLWTNVLE